MEYWRAPRGVLAPVSAHARTLNSPPREQEKVERVKEKEQDKEMRAKEREHDMHIIKDMITKGVQKEVEVAVQPIIERQLQLEQEQVNIKHKLSNLFQEMQEAKERIDFPTDHKSVKVGSYGVTQAQLT
jgi:hypothetical protein